MMRLYVLMGECSDVSVIDTEWLGDNGLEINTRDGRTWSSLSMAAVVEQLTVLRDQGVRMPPGCVDNLRRFVSTPPEAAVWMGVNRISGLLTHGA